MKVGDYLKDDNNPVWLGVVKEVLEEGDLLIAGIDAGGVGGWLIWGFPEGWPETVTIQEHPGEIQKHVLDLFVSQTRRDQKLRTLATPTLRPAGAFGRVEHGPLPDHDLSRRPFLSGERVTTLVHPPAKPPEPVFKPYEQVLVGTKSKPDQEKSLWERGWLICQLPSGNWVVEVVDDVENHVMEMFEVKAESIVKLPHVAWWKKLWQPI